MTIKVPKIKYEEACVKYLIQYGYKLVGWTKDGTVFSNGRETDFSVVIKADKESEK